MFLEGIALGITAGFGGGQGARLSRILAKQKEIPP
jgi:hypothetical protein